MFFSLEVVLQYKQTLFLMFSVTWELVIDENIRIALGFLRNTLYVSMSFSLLSHHK